MPHSSHLLHVFKCVFPVCSADSIEANVENADVHVQNATQQLSRAADYQVKLDRTGQGGDDQQSRGNTVLKGESRGIQSMNRREVSL